MLKSNNSSLSSAACGRTEIGFYGKFTSPNFPEKYPNGVVCTWTIKVPSPRVVDLTFAEFELEGE